MSICSAWVILAIALLTFWSAFPYFHKPDVLEAPPIWALAIPLPAVLIITLSLYLVLLGVAFWLRACLKVSGSGANRFRRVSLTSAVAPLSATGALLVVVRGLLPGHFPGL